MTIAARLGKELHVLFWVVVCGLAVYGAVHAASWALDGRNSKQQAVCGWNYDKKESGEYICVYPPRR